MRKREAIQFSTANLNPLLPFNSRCQIIKTMSSLRIYHFFCMHRLRIFSFRHTVKSHWEVAVSLINPDLHFLVAIKICGLKRWRLVHLKNRQLNLFLFLAQGIGAAFISVFSAAYLFALPSDGVLHSEPIFRLSLQIFGVFFLIFILLAVALSVFAKAKD